MSLYDYGLGTLAQYELTADRLQGQEGRCSAIHPGDF